jgi:hypothetical protein
MNIRQLLNETSSPNESSDSEKDTFFKKASASKEKDEPLYAETYHPKSEESEEENIIKEKAILENGYWIKEVDITSEDLFPLDRELSDAQKIKFYGQLEVAANKCYQVLLGSHAVPEDMIFDTERMMMKSKDIKGLKLWEDIYHPEHNTLNNNPITSNGLVKTIDTIKAITNLDEIGVAAWFLGEIDMHNTNFGVVETNVTFDAKKFDHGKTFSTINCELEFSKIHDIYSDEKLSYKIGYCYTDFPKEIIADEKRKDTRFKTVKTILQSLSELKKCIQDNIDVEFKQEKDRLISYLEHRHGQLCSQVKSDNNYQQWELKPASPYQQQNLFASSNMNVIEEKKEESIAKKKKFS